MSLHNDMMGAFFIYYKYMKGHDYRKTARDERHLKNIRKAIQDQCKGHISLDLVLATWKAFLLRIRKPWIIENLSLANIDSQFNQLWAEAIRGKYPNHYDPQLMRKLQGQEAVNYTKHLKKLGWTKIYSGTGGTTWQRPKLNNLKS